MIENIIRENGDIFEMCHPGDDDFDCNHHLTIAFDSTSCKGGL